MAAPWVGDGLFVAFAELEARGFLPVPCSPATMEEVLASCLDLGEGELGPELIFDSAFTEKPKACDVASFPLVGSDAARGLDWSALPNRGSDERQVESACI